MAHLYARKGDRPKLGKAQAKSDGRVARRQDDKKEATTNGDS